MDVINLVGFSVILVILNSYTASSLSQGTARSFLMAEMKKNQGLSHNAFASQLVARLRSKYPTLSFSAVSYPGVQGKSNHGLQCWNYQCAHVYRKYGRSVVIGWAKNQKIRKFESVKNANLHLSDCSAHKAASDIEKQLKRFRVSLSYIFTCRWKAGCVPGHYGGSNYYGRWQKCGTDGDYMWVQVMGKKKSWGKK